MLKDKTLGIIHATHISIGMCERYIKKFIPEVTVMHSVDDTVQRDNIAAPLGHLPKRNFYKFASQAYSLQQSGADMILLACTTFNQAAEIARPMIDIPIMQIEYPMMDMAIEMHDKIGILGTLPSAVFSEERLLNVIAREKKKNIIIESIVQNEAFKALVAGDSEKHNEMLIDSLKQLSRTSDCIILSQISMSVLEPRLNEVAVPVYINAEHAFPAIRETLEKI